MNILIMSHKQFEEWGIEHVDYLKSDHTFLTTKELFPEEAITIKKDGVYIEVDKYDGEIPLHFKCKGRLDLRGTNSR